MEAWLVILYCLSLFAIVCRLIFLFKLFCNYHSCSAFCMLNMWIYNSCIFYWQQTTVINLFCGRMNVGELIYYFHSSGNWMYKDYQVKKWRVYVWQCRIKVLPWKEACILLWLTYCSPTATTFWRRKFSFYIRTKAGSRG